MTTATTELWERRKARAAAQIALPDPAIRRALRVAGGLRLLDIAEVLGITIVAVSRYERGLREPQGDLRRRYADLLEELRSG